MPICKLKKGQTKHHKGVAFVEPTGKEEKRTATEQLAARCRGKDEEDGPSWRHWLRIILPGGDLLTAYVPERTTGLSK